MSKQTVKLVLLLAIAAAIALSGAGWKWKTPNHESGQTDGTYLIAGWTWDNAPVVPPDEQ